MSFKKQKIDDSESEIKLSISSKECEMKDKLDNLKKDSLYKLEKTLDKYGTSMVSAGHSVTGYLDYRLFEDEKGEYLVICVANPIDYLKPSYLKAIVESTDNSITFESQGGFYKLSWEKQ